MFESFWLDNRKGIWSVKNLLELFHQVSLGDQA